jgi:tRNA(Ile)-lysidine synthase TilS/MesJ
MPSKLKRLEASLLRKIISLNKNFSLIRPGNKVLVAVSGGKDSLSLARFAKAELLRRQKYFSLLLI